MAIAIGLPVNAAEFSIEIDSALSNNATQVNEGTITERQDKLSLSAAHAFENSDQLLELSYGLTYFNYAKSSQDNDTKLTGTLDYNYNFSPLTQFQLSHISSLSLIDPAAPSSPGNSATTHHLTTALSKDIRLTSIDSLNFTPRVSLNRNEDRAELDSEELGIDLSALRLLSPLNRASLNASFSRTEYESVPSTDRASWGIAFSRELRSVSYFIEGGYMYSDAGSKDSIETPTFELGLNFTGGHNELQFSASRQVTDTTSASADPDALLDNFSNRSLVEEFIQERYRISYLYTGLCGLCTNNTTVAFFTERYENSQLDSDTLSLLHTFSYRLSSRKTASFRLGYSEYKTPDSQATSWEEVKTDLSLSSQLTRHFSLSVYSSYQDRNAFLPSNSFEEFKVGIRAKREF
ncbi:hypothetical protein [Marinobacterium mangrovicola]|nr:hypothetical protein [Marinobacterium mangrovicola]